MDNIFEGAKFGDKFITRDGRLAIYHRYETRNDLNLHVLHVADQDCGLYCENNGLHAGNHVDFPEWDDDIVSRYEESDYVPSIISSIPKTLPDFGGGFTIRWSGYGWTIGYSKFNDKFWCWDADHKIDGGVSETFEDSLCKFIKTLE